MNSNTPDRKVEIEKELRSFEADHGPDGWPAVRMRQISAICDEVDRLKAEVAELDALRDRMADLLTRTAVALRGPEPPLPEPNLVADPCDANGTQTNYYTEATVMRLLADAIAAQGVPDGWQCPACKDGAAGLPLDYRWPYSSPTQEEVIAKLLGCCDERAKLASALEALKKAISEAEPRAWIVEGQTLGGNVAQYLAWNKSGAGQVPAPLQTEPEPLYTLKGIK